MSNLDDYLCFSYLTGLGQGSYRTLVEYSGMMAKRQSLRPPTKQKLALGPRDLH